MVKSPMKSKEKAGKLKNTFYIFREAHQPEEWGYGEEGVQRGAVGHAAIMASGALATYYLDADTVTERDALILKMGVRKITCKNFADPARGCGTRLGYIGQSRLKEGQQRKDCIRCDLSKKSGEKGKAAKANAAARVALSAELGLPPSAMPGSEEAGATTTFAPLAAAGGAHQPSSLHCLASHLSSLTVASLAPTAGAGSASPLAPDALTGGAALPLSSPPSLLLLTSLLPAPPPSHPPFAPGAPLFSHSCLPRADSRCRVSLARSSEN